MAVSVKTDNEKFCHECGTLIRAKAVVCPACGCQQHNGPPPVRVGRPRVTTLFYVFGVLCAAIGLWGLLSAAVHEQPYSNEGRGFLIFGVASCLVGQWMHRRWQRGK